MTALDDMLASTSGLRGAARATNSGTIEEFTGQVDAESSCAVAAMCQPHLKRIEELLGFGRVQVWNFTTTNVSFYVQQDVRGFVALVGESNKSAEATLKRIHTAASGKK